MYVNTIRLLVLRYSIKTNYKKIFIKINGTR